MAFRRRIQRLLANPRPSLLTEGGSARTLRVFAEQDEEERAGALRVAAPSGAFTKLRLACRLIAGDVIGGAV